MLEIIAASTFALALTIVVKNHKSDSSTLTESRATMLRVGIQIICGDCSGHDHFPIKTFLGRDCTCVQCGVRSYILASNRFLHAQTMNARQLEHESVPGNTRLEQLESSSSPRTTQLHAVTALESWRLVTWLDAHCQEGVGAAQ